MESTYVWEEVETSGTYSMDLGNNWEASMTFTGSKYSVKDTPRFTVWYLFDHRDRVSVEITGNIEHDFCRSLGSGGREASKIFLRDLDRLRSIEGLEGIGVERIIELYDSLDALEQRLKESWKTKLRRGISKSWEKAGQIDRTLKENPF